MYSRPSEEDIGKIESFIRSEIERLDKITGLDGRSLRIKFDGSSRRLGYYAPNRADRHFGFSLRYFADPEWPRAAALDVIRHEYAHYMDDMLNGNAGHSASWKRCCITVGACPTRCYDKRFTDISVSIARQKQAQADRCDSYTAGDVIVHPRFGRGRIVSVSGSAANKTAVVEFEGSVRKELGLAWIDGNCK